MDCQCVVCGYGGVQNFLENFKLAIGTNVKRDIDSPRQNLFDKSSMRGYYRGQLKNIQGIPPRLRTADHNAEMERRVELYNNKRAERNIFRIVKQLKRVKGQPTEDIIKNLKFDNSKLICDKTLIEIFGAEKASYIILLIGGN